ncbi:AsmA-like C-terminal region-containing protein [Gillisia sp. Q332]|uniref:AsmA-like C-terminal region-containing protein n=1 Tax=Gillisia xinjiangensis TaxID=3384765 RepID=UPI00391B2DD4
MKKVFKITGILLVVIVALLIAAPFIFEAQLTDMMKKSINKNVNAEVEFSDLDLTLFRSFPQATLVLKDVSVINKEPFKGDTLAFGGELLLEMSIKELFKGSDKPKKIDKLKLDNAFINIQVDSLGNNNYDISIEDLAAEGDTVSTPFRLDLKHYEINNSRLKYVDKGQKLLLYLEDLNHKGTGDFSLEQSELETSTSAFVTMDYDGVNYLNKNRVGLEAVIQMDLEELKYTFLENEATVNQLPLTFEGFVDVNENNNEIDISFKTLSSDFKNFLAVMPEIYAKNIENVQNTGDFIVNGRMHGIIDDTYIPKMDIKVTSNNASFKYPDLPKSVQDINIDLAILNETGLLNDTYLTFDNVTFRIDQDVFAANGNIRNLTENMLVNMALKGTVNLANIKKAYPLDLEQDLNGILTIDAKTSFDMNSIEKEQYQNVNSNGNARITDFRYTSPEIPNEIRISTANFNLNQGDVRVPQLNMTTGQTDISASGNIQNLMGFLFTDQKLKGDFQVNSNTFSINDFMIAATTEEVVKTPDGVTIETKKEVPTGEEAIKIPSFLDAKVDFSANKVLYDNLVLNNAKGTLYLKDETATLQNVTSNIFDGTIALNGNVSTKADVPTFKMNLDLNSLDIAKSFNGLKLLQGLTPIAAALEGKLQTRINLAGNLNDDFTPQLTSLAGEALAQLLTAEVQPEKLALLGRLDEQLKFIDFKDINLDNLKSRLTFNNGFVEIEPFDFNVKGINVQVAGSHGFDMNMNYNVTLDVPARFLGSELGTALSKLSVQDLQSMTVALPIGLTGTFQNPNINLNMEQAVSNLTQKIVAQQKAALTKKGIDALGNIIGGRTQPKTPDSTATPEVVKKDSIKNTQEQQVKDAARDILGGLLGGKKKPKDTTKVN